MILLYSVYGILECCEDIIIDYFILSDIYWNYEIFISYSQSSITTDAYYLILIFLLIIFLFEIVEWDCFVLSIVVFYSNLMVC